MQIHCFYSEICNAVMDYRRFHAKIHAQAAALAWQMTLILIETR